MRSPSTVLRLPSWLPYAVLAGGAWLRLFHLGDWSLWFDEETSIYFALNPGKPFARSSPLYFWLLGRVYDVTGVSIYAGRLMSAVAGILTLWLAWRCIRRFCGDGVALPALVLLVLSPGHLFWSQSIRCYMLVLLAQLASVDAFLRALKAPSARWWALSAMWLLLALTMHIVAVLIVPVYLGVIVWMIARRGMGLRLSWGLMMLGLVAIMLAVVAWLTLLSLHTLFGRQPMGIGTHLLERFAGYVGVPAVALMVVGIVLAWRSSVEFVFFLLLAIVPLVELMLMRQTGLWSVAWYHGLVAIVGVAAVAGYGWQALTERLQQPIVASMGAAVLGGSLAVIAAYFVTAFGDRPRWREAAAVLSQHHITVTTTGVDVISNAPGVMAYYLGVAPGRTMGHPLVRLAPEHLAPTPVIREAWFAIEGRLLPPETAAWLEDRCEPMGVFTAEMIVRDRTVLVYRCRPR